ncbi:MAG: siphovirus ReqiPepy6 Gp37-like family protein, partial [Ruminococcus sp.]|nr:siphovirus ReqiPepy6 Gp37-like family protein [Ruminococcus sp.]
MEIAVHDGNGVLLGFIDDFSSLLWTRRFSSAGSFELCVPATKENAVLIAPVRFVRRTDNGEAMYISTVREETNNEGEGTITASGYSLDGLFRKLAMPLDPQEYCTVFADREYDEVYLHHVMSAEGTGDTVKLTGALSLPVHVYVDDELPNFGYKHRDSDKIKLLIKLREEYEKQNDPTGNRTSDIYDTLNGFAEQIAAQYESMGRYYAVNMTAEDYIREILSANGYRVDAYLDSFGIGYKFVKPKKFQPHSSPVFSSALETVSSANFEYSEEGCYNAVRVVCNAPAD